MRRFAVFGNPIEQSKSPTIHKQFAKQFGIQLEYEKTLIPVGDFQQVVDKFFTHDQVKGCNVTAPFKLDAFEFADQLSEVAKVAGAVNTLTKTAEGLIRGDNTDGGGLINHIQQTIALKDQSVLLLGAGGAARGVLLNLLEQKPCSLTIANRTLSKAQALIDTATNYADQIAYSANSFDDLQANKFDIVINATSSSLTGDIPAISSNVIDGAKLAYDMSYADKPTAFLTWAKQHGALATLDGLGMLVGQAALSFEIWTGLKPDTDAVIKLLR
jgi:shikimate dehydrogenase